MTTLSPERTERARRMLDAYVRDDMMLEQIGQRHGVTRERVRQIVTAYDPTLYWLSQLRRKARIRLRRFVDDGKGLFLAECRLCGESFETSDPRRRHCSPIHGQIARLLLYHADEDRRDAQRRWIAEWKLRNGLQTFHAQRVLTGKVGTEGTQGGAGQRWIIPGSLAFHWAIRAYVLDWPVFDRLHHDVQTQIRTHVAGEDAAPTRKDA